MSKFKLNNIYPPKGDQPQAIKSLVQGYKKYSAQTLLGVTGSGKTFTIANVVDQLQKPTLVLSHNKTLAAQLYQEFQIFFPDNKVCYFISYYDYYQPESYLPASDTYIEKDSNINERIEQMRLEAAASIMSRDDIIVVSSVSCIYGFGNAQDFEGESFQIKVGQKLNRQELLKDLVRIMYERNDTEIKPGLFRVKGDTIDIFPGYTAAFKIRVEFFGDEIDKITEVQAVTNKKINDLKSVYIYPARPFVVPESRIPQALSGINQELARCLPKLDVIEAHRLKQRTSYDLEMIEQLGYCKGIENYSRYFDQRAPGEPPYTLIDFFNYKFGEDWLFVIDESHQSIPQLHGMYNGDRSRKETLVEYGFRLPSALDNRPLKFEELEKYLKHVIYVSATPSDYEIKTSGKITEQIIRPTGLLDPIVIIRPAEGQIEDVMKEIKNVTENGYRTLVTTLTKRMAEDLTYYLIDNNIKAVYLHSDIDTLERTKIIKDLRLGRYDVLVGINLLREGLDIPEVAFVGILDADKEGFLRNTRSLVQTMGRAARNVNSRVILYADRKTQSIKDAIRETNRRREIQMAYNKKHGITPKTIEKSIAEEEIVIEPNEDDDELKIDKLGLDLEGQMLSAAEDLDFEKAIDLRDKIEQLKKKLDE